MDVMVAKKRHIAMQSTSQMQEPLEMFSLQYENNPVKTVGGDAIWKTKI